MLLTCSNSAVGNDAWTEVMLKIHLISVLLWWPKNSVLCSGVVAKQNVFSGRSYF